MVMSPQPAQRECTDKLPHGTVIRLRSIRPEDEPLLLDFAAHMSLRICGFASSRRCED
jgi:hypothetical protein